MEELSKIAKAYYQASTEHLQGLARDFFKEMDNDGDGKIDLKEFQEFMKEQGYGQLVNRFFFNQLDLDRSGTLDFFEVLTFYYIIKSGRPFCDYCKMFITSTFFTCVGCLEDPEERAFHLCVDCYLKRRCNHTRHDMSRFLDNYSLLEALTKLKFGEEPRPSDSSSRPLLGDSNTWNQYAAPGAPPTPVIKNHTFVQHNTYNYTLHHYVQHPATSNRIIPRRERWEVALGALDTAIQLSAAGSLCSIL